MKLIYAISIIVVVFVVVEFVRPDFFSSFLSSFATPFWRAEFAMSLGSLKSNAELLSENEQLKRQIESDAINLQTVRAIQTENETLKAMMGRASSTPYILSAVLVRPPISGFDMIIIDIGEDYGIKVDDLVYASGDVLIGRVREVNSHTSKVMLFSSVKEEYQVEIGSMNAPSTAYGKGGGQYKAELPRDVKIQEGDFVVAPSLSSKPFGIVIGVNIDPTSPFQNILFAPPLNIYELRWVLVDHKP